jgi:hypothetical protein
MSLPDEPRWPYLSEDGPWDGRDVVRLIGLAGMAFASIVASWAGTSNQTALSEQVPWVLLGVGGVALVLYAGAGWVAQGGSVVRAEHRRLRRRAPSVLATLLPESTADSGWVRATGMTMVHRRDCQLVRGKAVDAVTGADSSRRCGVCGP